MPSGLRKHATASII